MSYPRIFSKVFNEPALLTASAHQAIQTTLISHIEGGNLFDMRRDQERSVQVKDKSYKLVDGNVGLVEISGIISRRLSMVEGACGMYEQAHISEAIKQACDDPRVDKIILDIDSPGGSVVGTYETGRMIREMRETKPIYAYTETLACSAAYWLAAQCTAIISAPSAIVGSIGVYMAWIVDGEDYDLVKAGKFKAMGINPITAEEREILQANVDKTHALFKAEVLAMRPDIPADAMEGLSYEGAEAESLGLVDALALNFDEALEMIR